MNRALRRALRGAVAAAALTPLLVAAPNANATRSDREDVVSWVERHSSEVVTTDPDATDRDLRALRKSLTGARLVGLGEASHRLAELTDLKHRMVRHLIEDRGFRSIVWEEDWSLGTQINEYVLGRRDDLKALVKQMSKTAWQTREVADVLAWLRSYNDTHRQKVRFFGAEYYATRPFVYDDLERYVDRAAPDLLPEAKRHLDELEPNTDDMGKYLAWYAFEVDDKAPFIRHARALYDLVASIRGAGSSYAVAEHAARQIRSWYIGFSLADNFAYRDARAAENIRWWMKHYGGKAVYWGAAAHTADVPNLRISLEGRPDTTFASVGSFLRDWYGRRYLSIGFTFDRGSIDVTPGRPIELPEAPETWFEHPMAQVCHDQFFFDVRRRGPRPVRDWLDAPMVTRGYPEAGLASHMSGGTPAEWFDVVFHRQAVSPATPIT